MIYEVMDVREMAYPDNNFDMVIDKSTIDTLMCSENPIINAAKMLEECYINTKAVKRKDTEGRNLMHYLWIYVARCLKSLCKDKSDWNSTII
jgi:hypothetical protein